MGHAHGMVVDDVGEVIGRQTVAFEQYAVIDIAAMPVLWSPDFVVKANVHLEGTLRRTTQFVPSATKQATSSTSKVRLLRMLMRVT